MSWSTIRKRPKQRTTIPDKNSDKTIEKVIPHQLLEELKKENLGENLDETIEFFTNLLGKNVDFFCRHFKMYGTFRAAIIYFSSLVDKNAINNEIMKPLMYVPIHTNLEQLTKATIKDFILNETMFHCETKEDNNIEEIVKALLSGEAIIFIDGLDKGIRFSVKNIEKRSISQPETEQVILGPREGFIESLQTNLALLRNRLPKTLYINPPRT